MKEYLICFSIVSFFCFLVHIITSGLFCKIVGHKYIACGWTETHNNRGMCISRKATDFYCERCGKLKNRVKE